MLNEGATQETLNRSFFKAPQEVLILVLGHGENAGGRRPAVREVLSEGGWTGLT